MKNSLDPFCMVEFKKTYMKCQGIVDVYTCTELDVSLLSQKLDGCLEYADSPCNTAKYRLYEITTSEDILHYIITYTFVTF